MDKFTIGDRIRLVRESAGLNQEGFARATSVTNVTISRYEKGHRTPDAEFLNLLVKLYGCDPAWLLVGEGTGVVAEEHEEYQPRTIVKKKIDQLLDDMDEEAQRDVLKYAEEKKLLRELMKERKKEG